MIPGAEYLARGISMKRRGIAYIYVLIIMIPVMALFLALMDMALTDDKIGINLVYKQQAKYNCEAGIKDGIVRCESLTYNKFKQAIYYIDFCNEIKILTQIPSSQDFVKIVVTYSTLNLNQKYTIDATGYFKESQREKVVIYNET